MNLLSKSIVIEEGYIIMGTAIVGIVVVISGAVWAVAKIDGMVRSLKQTVSGLQFAFEELTKEVKGVRAWAREIEQEHSNMKERMARLEAMAESDSKV